MAATRTTAAAPRPRALTTASAGASRPARRGLPSRAPHTLSSAAPAVADAGATRDLALLLRRQAAADLLDRADAELLAAQLATDPAERFTHAHMAALRVSGAVLAVLGTRPPRGRTRSAWERLSAASEDFVPWASFFASGAHLRSSIDAGRFDAVDEGGAARWVAAAEDFRDEVGSWVDDAEVPLGRSSVLGDRPVSA